MLVLTRRPNEKIFLTVPGATGETKLTIMVCSVGINGAVRVGIDAPREVQVIRDDARVTEKR